MTFWQEDCPARGVALSHMKSSQCSPQSHPGYDSGHLYNQCCHCRGLDAPTRASSMVMPPIDVAARLASLGYMQIPEPPVDEPVATDPEPDPYHDPNTPVEPKAVTDIGPTGNPYGPGRGGMTPRYEKRLLGYVGWRAWLAERGEGEQ